jgi:GNAT superfamily N-acetyltransferase
MDINGIEFMSGKDLMIPLEVTKELIEINNAKYYCNIGDYPYYYGITIYLLNSTKIIAWISVNRDIEGGVCKLKELRVEKEFRRKKIGSYLVEEVVKKFHNNIIYLALDLWSNVGVDILKRFYGRYGFTQDKESDQIMIRMPI